MVSDNEWEDIEETGPSGDQKKGQSSRSQGSKRVEMMSDAEANRVYTPEGQKYRTAFKKAMESGLAREAGGRPGPATFMATSIDTLNMEVPGLMVAIFNSMGAPNREQVTKDKLTELFARADQNGTLPGNEKYKESTLRGALNMADVVYMFASGS